MSVPKIATSGEWLKARLELLEREKELTRQRDAVSRLRRELPWVPLGEDYLFDGDEGPVSLSQLFGDCSQLLVQHFMFAPDWEAGCKSCSFWTDNFQGLEMHLKARDIAMAMVSKAPRAKTRPFQERMGWGFTWVSSANNRFNEDFKVSFPDRTDMAEAVHYNYRDTQFPVNEAPGVSIFTRDQDGGLYHSYSTFARGLDMLNCAYNLIDLTPKGRDEMAPMDWLRFRDSYEVAAAAE